MKNRFWSIVLILCMVLTLLPFGAVPASAADVGDLACQIKNGTIEITNCNRDISGALVIPAEINGYPVTSIGEKAFNGCTGLTSVTIPDGVTKIGALAFYSLNLTSVTIPDSVISIGSDAFTGTNLYNDASNWTDGALYIGSALLDAKEDITSLHIKDGTRVIAEGAFPYGSLTSVTIPKSVTSIGDSAFADCANLTSIEVEAGNPSYRSVDGVLFSQDGTTLVCFPRGSGGTYQIPNSVTTIGSSAFSGCGLTSVTIPDSVTSIGERAFYGCSSLTSVKLPSGLTSIGKDAFYYCTGLTSVTIPSSVTSLGEYAFEECSNLASVTIPNSLTAISKGAFYRCESLASVKIPDSVKRIENYAFWGCSSLTPVTIPDSVTSLGTGAFGYCLGMTKVTIPDSVTSLGASVFEGCTGLTSATIPDSVTEIADGLFYRCKGLTSVTFPDGVTKIGDSAFYECTGLTSVTIPESVTSIGATAFYSCSSLASVTIPNSVVSIGADAFYGSKLYDDESNWTDGVLYIDHALVAAKEDVTACKVKADTRVVAGGALCGLKSIGVETGSRYLRTIDGVLFNKDATTLVCFPGKRSGTYQIPKGVTAIGDYAFYSCGGLTEVKIPEGVTSIGDGAFSNCYGLTSVVIPEGVTSIGEGAFAGSEFLVSLTVPDSVNSIGEGAFDTCPIESLTIPEGVTVLKKDVLRNCGPSPIWLPRSLKVIEEEALGNWIWHGGLEGEIYYGGTPEEWEAIEGIPNPYIIGNIHYTFNSPTPAPTATPAPTPKPTATPAPTPAPTAKPTATPAPTAKPTATPAPTAKPEVKNPFEDVSKDQYYYDPVLWAVNHDPQITAGTSATTFSPDASCTRGQIVTFLWRANGQPEPTISKNPFTDVKSTDYFYKAVLWAVEKEITAGTSATTFSPAATVTRAQTVTFLWRAEGKPAATAKNPFTDVPAGQYYTDAVLWAVKNEITAGTSATTFSPNNPCTRGQIVTFLYRYMK